ncbi:VanZ family protein [Caproicibacterium sp. XB1]|uniref:VanZ family protein n=1 Tax=Caproicibacterium sp. XB1 TaxID=3396405 RepID=UPI0039B6FABA
MKQTGLRVRQWLCFFLAVGCMVCIYAFSAQSGKASDAISIPVAHWLQQNLHLAFSDTQMNHFVRKAAHFGIYFLLAAFFGGWISGFQWSSAVWVTICVGFCALYAAGDEFHQSFSAQRTPSLRDVLLDMVGALLGALFTLLLLHIFYHFHGKKGGASMICPNCGFDNPTDVICCVKCGEPLVDSQALFSPDGTKIDLSEPDIYEPYEDEEADVPEHKSRAPLVILILFLSLLAVAAGLSLAWYQEKGEWPWQQFLTGTASVQSAEENSSLPPLKPQRVTRTYSAADLASAVQESGFQAFAVSETEISEIKVDSQTFDDATLVQFTVKKAMAVLHMQIRFPEETSASSVASTAQSAAVSSAAKQEKPIVTSWGVDTWNLTGTWNDAGGNTLVITSCSGGSMNAYYIPAGKTDSRQVTGSISETGDISLLSSKAQINGRFSPNGTGLLSVTLDGSKTQTQEFVMLSTALASIPSPSSAASADSSAVPSQIIPTASADSVTSDAAQNP